MTLGTSDQLLLRVEEAARLLNISRSHLYDELNAGMIPLVYIGAARRVPRRALEAWIERQVEQQSEATDDLQDRR